MTDKTMTSNGWVVNWSTYRGLKEDEKSNQFHISLRKGFDNRIKEKFGPDISPYDFPDVNLEDTPLYGMYEDDTMDAEGGLAANS